MSIREQSVAAAGDIGAIVPLVVEGIDEPLFVQRLSLLDRVACAEQHDNLRYANVRSAVNLVAKAVVTQSREPYQTWDLWHAWANRHTDLFAKLSNAVRIAQGDVTPEESAALGNGSGPTSPSE